MILHRVARVFLVLAPLMLALLTVEPGVQAQSAQDESSRSDSQRSGSAQARTYSAAGLYNLANSYQRAGKPGMAILNYERAGLLAPGDPDIAANLSAVRVASGLATEQAAWYERAATLVNPALAAWSALVGLLVIGAAVLVGRGSARLRWWRRVGVLVGALLIGATVAQGIVLWPRLQRAIVLVAGAPVRATPAPLGDTLFTLPEGTEVQMLGEHQDFVFVQIKPATRGWISRASIATVLP